MEAEVRTYSQSTSLRGAPIFPLNAAAADDPGTASLRQSPARGGRAHAGASRRRSVSTCRGSRLHACRSRHRRDGNRSSRDRYQHRRHGDVMPRTRRFGCAASTRRIVLPKRIRRPALRTQYRRRREERDLARRLARRSARARVDDAYRCPPALAGRQRPAARDVVADSTCISARRTASLTSSCWSRIVLSAGESARVQLVFDTPVCALPGDRFIVRDAQAAHTIGGGVVLDPFAPSRRRRSAERLRYLDAIERMIARRCRAAAAGRALTA